MSLFFRSRRGPADDADVLPTHFHEPIRAWCQALFSYQNGLAERVRLRLQAESLRIPRDLLPVVQTILELGAESAVAQTGDSGWYSGTTTSRSGFRVVRLESLQDVQHWRQRVRQLDLILLDGGSVWEVAPDGAGLQLRVNPAEGGALRTAVATARASTRPAGGDDLTTAWNAAYGRSPNPSEAYRLAIRAVEHAAVPVIIPTSKLATLGTVIKAMRDAPGKWTFDPGTGHFTAITVPIGLLESLWKGQDDRHGGQADFAEVTQSEAEGAVHLAVQLVRWFTTGAISQATATATAVGSP